MKLIGENCDYIVSLFSRRVVSIHVVTGDKAILRQRSTGDAKR